MLALAPLRYLDGIVMMLWQLFLACPVATNHIDFRFPRALAQASETVNVAVAEALPEFQIFVVVLAP